jgi:hypothetical protein
MVYVFLFLGLFFATFYGIKGDAIYGTATKDKKEHWALSADLYMQRFWGVFLGWMMMWWLLEKQLDVFCFHHPYHPVVPVNFMHVVVFILALIAIFGRLPLLVNNLITLFGYGKKEK